jgi:hypothetical protein
MGSGCALHRVGDSPLGRVARCFWVSPVGERRGGTRFCSEMGRASNVHVRH